MQMKSMFSLGLGEQNSWRLSSSPRGRRPCTSSISTTTLISGAFTFPRNRIWPWSITQSYLYRKARLNPLRRLWQAPGEAFERWQLLLKMWNNSAVQSPPTCPWAEACQHCQVSRWKGTQLNCCLLLSFASHLSLKFRHCGALEQCGQSPTMPTTTLAAGTITIYIFCSKCSILRKNDW